MTTPEAVIDLLERSPTGPWAPDDRALLELVETVEAQPHSRTLLMAVLQFLTRNQAWPGGAQHPAFIRLGLWLQGKTYYPPGPVADAIAQLDHFPPPPWPERDEAVELLIRAVEAQPRDPRLDEAVWRFLARNSSPKVEPHYGLSRLARYLAGATAHETSLVDALREQPNRTLLLLLTLWWQDGHDTIGGIACGAFVDELLTSRRLKGHLRESLEMTRYQMTQNAR